MSDSSAEINEAPLRRRNASVVENLNGANKELIKFGNR